jgi:hypothetical protein
MPGVTPAAFRRCGQVAGRLDGEARARRSKSSTSARGLGFGQLYAVWPPAALGAFTRRREVSRARGLRRASQVRRGTTRHAHQSQGAPFVAACCAQEDVDELFGVLLNLRGQDLLRRPASPAHFAAVPAELQRT